MKYKKFILLQLCLIFVAGTFAQDNEWELNVKYKKEINADYLNLTTDNHDNVIVTGFFSDSLIIGEMVFQTKGTLDIFVAKFNPSGELLWIKQVGGTNVDFSKFISADANDNIYIQGLYRGIAKIGSVELNSKGSYDLFTAKFSKQGDLIWVKTNQESRVKRIPKFNI